MFERKKKPTTEEVKPDDEPESEVSDPNFSLRKKHRSLTMELLLRKRTKSSKSLRKSKRRKNLKS